MSDEQYPEDDFPQEAPPQEGAPQEQYPQEQYPQEAYPQEAYPQEGYPQEAYPQGEAPADPLAAQSVPPPPGVAPEAYPQQPEADGWAAQDPAQQSVPPPPLGGADEAYAQPAAAPEPEIPAPDAFGMMDAGRGSDAPEVVAQGHAAAAAALEDRPKKKRKIDLKARLSSVRAAGTMAGTTSAPEGQAGPASTDGDAAFPPPPVTGSVPPPRMLSGAGIAPPPGLLGTAQAEEESRPAQAQTIKVEMGPEVLAERRKTRKRMALYGLIAALVTAVFGFFIGSTKAQGDAQRESVRGAQGIIKDVEASAEVLSSLSDVLREAGESLKAEKYPADLADKLKGTHVPFSAEGLSGKKVSGLPGSVLRALLSYAGDVERLNKRKDRLRNILGMAKKPFEEYVTEKKEPKMRFSVVFSPGKKGMMAELAPHTKDFLFKEDGDWPEKYKVMRLQRGKGAETEVERWKKGDLTGQTPLAIPVDQRTVAAFTSKQMILDMSKALKDTKDLVDGVQSQIPAEQTDGLIKDGEQLIAELKKVVAKGGK